MQLIFKHPNNSKNEISSNSLRHLIFFFFRFITLFLNAAFYVCTVFTANKMKLRFSRDNRLNKWIFRMKWNSWTEESVCRLIIFSLLTSVLRGLIRKLSGSLTEQIEIPDYSISDLQDSFQTTGKLTNIRFHVSLHLFSERPKMRTSRCGKNKADFSNRIPLRNNLQSNLSTTTTIARKSSGRCREEASVGR